MAKDSGRNHGLNRAAFKLGRLVPGLLDLEVVRAALLNACRANGLLTEDGETRCRKSMESGLAAGMAEPEEVAEETGPAAEDPEPEPRPGVGPAGLVRLPGVRAWGARLVPGPHPGAGFPGCPGG